MATTQAMEEQQASNEAAYSAADNVKQAKNYAGKYAGYGAALSLAMPGLGTLAAAAVGYTIGKWKTAKQKKKMYKAYYNAAQATLQEREQNAQYDNYLNMIRQARIARAGTLASATSANLMTSSLSTSALSSIGAQSQYSMQYTANDQRLIKQYEDYMTKAKSAAAKYQANMSVVNAAIKIPLTVGGAVVGGTFAGPTGAVAGAQLGSAAGKTITDLTNIYT